MSLVNREFPKVRWAAWGSTFVVSFIAISYFMVKYLTFPLFNSVPVGSLNLAMASLLANNLTLALMLSPIILLGVAALAFTATYFLAQAADWALKALWGQEKYLFKVAEFTAPEGLEQVAQLRVEYDNDRKVVTPGILNVLSGLIGNNPYKSLPEDIEADLKKQLLPSFRNLFNQVRKERFPEYTQTYERTNDGADVMAGVYAKVTTAKITNQELIIPVGKSADQLSIVPPEHLYDDASSYGEKVSSHDMQIIMERKVTPKI